MLRCQNFPPELKISNQGIKIPTRVQNLKPGYQNSYPSLKLVASMQPTLKRDFVDFSFDPGDRRQGR
jgi:hypothetical protein